MSPEITTTDVEIFGTVYHVRGEKGSERLRELAELVDKTMREIARHVSTVDTGRIAILAALNLADELIQAREQLEGERVEIQETAVRLSGKLEEALQG